MTRYILIVAGGSGIRMNALLPKQFMELRGKPVLMHTLEVFARFDKHAPLILVLPENQFDFWKELCTTYAFTLKHKLVAGGSTRFHSVQNGLNQVPHEGLVAIHDGVRPLVSPTTIERCFAQAVETGNAVPCIPVHESMRKVTDGMNTPVDRSRFRLIQTPQVFACKLIKDAYKQPYDPSFTDDASVLENTGQKICLVAGNRENIKITEPIDLLLAEGLLKRK